MELIRDPKWTPEKNGRPDGFKIITRGHWGCKLNSMPAFFTYRRTPWNIYYMNTFTAKCDTEADCKASMLSMMEKHSDVKFIPRYNFIIGGDGNVYEVRGWKYSPILPKGYKYNQSSGFLLGFLGIYNEVTMPENIFNLALKFIRYGQHMDHIQKNIQIFNILDRTIVHSQPPQTLSESDFGYY